MAYIDDVQSNLTAILTTLKDSPLITNARTQVQTAASDAALDATTKAQILVNFELSLAKDLTNAALQSASDIPMKSSQQAMVVAQTAEVAPNATKQRAVQDAQIAQVNAETSYTQAKEDIAKNSRIDNLLIEAEKAQMQQLATVGAGGLVPSTNDFDAGNKTRQSVYDRAVSGASAIGQTLPSITFTAGTNYTKAT